MRILACLFMVLLPCVATAAFNVGDRIIARWTNNLYYPGKVETFPSPDKIKIRFDDGDEITHSIEDGTAVIADKAPEKVEVTDHVIARFKGSSKYFIGFVIDETTSGTPIYKVLFDDGDTAWYKAQDLRIFPYMTDKMALGARVFAKYTNDVYYRGFVVKDDSKLIYIRYDDGDSISYGKFFITPRDLVLDELPHPRRFYSLGKQRVIGFWPDGKYYPGYLVKEEEPDDNETDRWAGRRYYVEFDDGDSRWEQFYQFRLLPTSFYYV